jgi:hypothetical protein
MGLGNYTLNATTFLLDMFAKIGWAYDLKSPSKKLIQQTIENNGDGTHRILRVKKCHPTTLSSPTHLKFKRFPQP